MELIVFTYTQRGRVEGTFDPNGLAQKAILLKKGSDSLLTLLVGSDSYHRQLLRSFLTFLGARLSPIGPNEEALLLEQLRLQGYSIVGGCDIHTDSFTQPHTLEVFGHSLSFGELSEASLQTIASRIGATYKK